VSFSNFASLAGFVELWFYYAEKNHVTHSGLYFLHTKHDAIKLLHQTDLKRVNTRVYANE
jgi:hypothetical protein